MIDSLLLRHSLLALAIVVPAAEAAGPDALLARMQHASRNLDYDGVFVYQRGDQLDSLRIIHKAGADGVRERLVSLNGAPREIIRNDREVHCFLPDENAVLIEHRRADNRNFPALLPESLAQLNRNYKIRVGKEGRVAGRTVRAVLIKPRDGLRYGYQLWADTATGLLLKAGLVDEHGAMLEQYMFAQINIGRPIAENDLKSQIPANKFIRQPPEPAGAENAPRGWGAAELPAGFSLTTRMSRPRRNTRLPMEHIVYSDGLAVVSVFIEPLPEQDGQESLEGITRMGAVHVYNRTTNGHRVTVMGEVPAATVSMVGNSIHAPP